MSVTIGRQEFLVGPATNRGSACRSWRVFDHVWYQNQNCPLYRSIENNRIYIKVQHLNNNFPTFYPLRTREQLLLGWS